MTLGQLCRSGPMRVLIPHREGMTQPSLSLSLYGRQEVLIPHREGMTCGGIVLPEEQPEGVLIPHREGMTNPDQENHLLAD